MLELLLAALLGHGPQTAQTAQNTNGPQTAQTAQNTHGPQTAQNATAPPATSSSGTVTLDYDFYKARIQPLFLEKREGHARCATCHEGSTTLRLQRRAEGADAWTEEQTRQNFEAVKAMVVPGSPGASRLLLHPLARA